MDLTHPKKRFQNQDTTQFMHAWVLISLLSQVAEIKIQTAKNTCYMISNVTE